MRITATDPGSACAASPLTWSFDDVKAQIIQRLEQIKLQQYQEELRKAAKTDYKFAQQ